MRQVLWTLLLLLVAVAAIAAQLDRQSRYHPGLAKLVPEAFRSFAAFELAAEAAHGDNPAEALRRARLLVARRPIPAEHLSLLAAAQLEANSQPRAQLTIQQAARRGWRDLAAQRGMLGLALKAGDDGEAAARLAALLVLEPDEQALAAMATIALARPGTRQAFAEILASRPRWQSPVMLRLVELVPTSIFTDTLERASAAGALLDCAQLRRAIPVGKSQIMPRACQ